MLGKNEILRISRFYDIPHETVVTQSQILVYIVHVLRKSSIRNVWD